LESWRRVVATAAQEGIPTPAFSSSLAYFDGLRRNRLPAALIQGLRDYFGAHTYHRVDRPGSFHTLWGGDRKEISA
jgi:6-phosphogluconate dehydrogenase